MPDPTDGAGPNTPQGPIDLGDVGVIYADLSGYTQLVYQCVGDEARLQRLALAMRRLLAHDVDRWPDVEVEGYAGDGFLALCTGAKPAREGYAFATALHERFDHAARPLLHDLGFRVDVRLRCALHVGRVYRVPLREAGVTGSGSGSVERRLTLSDAAIVASRVVTSQTCRRFGLALSRQAFKRLLLAGGKAVREPDEVILDRNQYPEPIEVYRLRETDDPAGLA